MKLKNKKTIKNLKSLFLSVFVSERDVYQNAKNIVLGGLERILLSLSVQKGECECESDGGFFTVLCWQNRF